MIGWDGKTTAAGANDEKPADDTQAVAEARISEAARLIAERWHGHIAEVCRFNRCQCGQDRMAAEIQAALESAPAAGKKRADEAEAALATEREMREAGEVSARNLAHYAESPLDRNYNLPMSGPHVVIRDALARALRNGVIFAQEAGTKGALLSKAEDERDHWKITAAAHAAIMIAAQDAAGTHEDVDVIVKQLLERERQLQARVEELERQVALVQYQRAGDILPYRALAQQLAEIGAEMRKRMCAPPAHEGCGASKLAEQWDAALAAAREAGLGK